MALSSRCACTVVGKADARSHPAEGGPARPVRRVPRTLRRLLRTYLRLRTLLVRTLRKQTEVPMARNRWWSMMLVVCHLLGLFTALVAAHTQIPARAQVGWASWYGPGFHR